MYSNTMETEQQVATLPAAELPVIDIKPLKGWISLNLKEMWQYRDLLYFLVWRDVKVKYKQTLLGFAWAVIVPLTTTVIFGTIFGKIAKLSSDGLNPYIFYLAGLVIWEYFAGSLTMSSNSLIGSASLLTKIYLPRLFIPMGSCLANLVDFTIAFGILVILMFCLKIVPAVTILLVPLLVLVAFATALGVGLTLSALNVKYRDVRYVIPFLVQVWMYCSVLLPFSNIPQRWGIWRYFYGLNPMAGVIELNRWCLMHHKMFLDSAGTIPVPAPWGLLAVGLPVTVVLLLFGLYYFKRMEKMFADIV